MSIPADPSVQYFHALTRDEKIAAIKRMAAEGWTDHTIAHATKLSCEFVRQVLAARVSR